LAGVGTCSFSSTATGSQFGGVGSDGQTAPLDEGCGRADNDCEDDGRDKRGREVERKM
jgi:hypothetical protein